MPFSSSTDITSRLLQPHPQLPLLLHNLQLQPLNTVLQRLLPLLHGSRSQARLAVQRLPALAAATPTWCARNRRRRHTAAAAAVVQPPGVELAARLERLDPPCLPLDLVVCAVEE